MDINLSHRADNSRLSDTMSVVTTAKELSDRNFDVISLAAGEPDFPTPDFIREKTIEALNEGQTRYTNAAGLLELREAICEKLKNENGLSYSSNQIIVNFGAKHSMYEAIQAIAEQNDEVIIPSPWWVTYPEAVKLSSANPVEIAAKKENGYKITPEQLENTINEKTKAIIFNSPNNPTGAVYTRKQMLELAKVLKGTDIIVISDEIYEKFIYQDREFTSFASLNDDCYDRTVTINGCSKSYAMTGWRVGYAAGPDKIIDSMIRMQSHMTHNTPPFVQAGAKTAIKKGAAFAEKMRVKFRERAKFLTEKLNSINGIKCNMPEGAFYCFADISGLLGKKSGESTITNSIELAFDLLKKQFVATVPGDYFGCENHIRLTFTKSAKELEQASFRIDKWTKQLT